MRGPGETQLETDRRLINNRIRNLRAKLEEVQKSREVQRSGRRTEFRASLVGYTNAGKSSILRALSQSPEIFVEDRLFATLDPLTREIQLGENAHVLLTDTVGFIRKLPHNLVASFRATLEEVNEADLLLHVIDASHPTWEEQRDVVDQVLIDLGVGEKPVLHVFSKIDVLSPEDLTALQDRVRNLIPDSIFVSAVEEGGLQPLRRALLKAARAGTRIAEIRIPISDGKLLAEIYRSADVIEQRNDDDDIVITARLASGDAGRLLSLGAAIGYNTG